jgi:RecB family endonuclease NucS
MPLFRADATNQSLIEERPVSFATQQWHERRDLQPLLRENPSAIDSNLMIISEEFGDWEESSRRIDLLGLDRDGNLVVIELKRVEEGAHMELQAIRYAAMVSSLDFEASFAPTRRSCPSGARTVKQPAKGFWTF